MLQVTVSTVRMSCPTMMLKQPKNLSLEEPFATKNLKILKKELIFIAR